MNDTPDTPVAKVESQPKRSSLLWIVPFVALAAVVAFVFIQASAERGPRIAIMFTDASGLKPGADLVHRGLHVGVVRSVELDSDLKTVIVRAEIAPHAAGLAREGTKFWIVRPEVSLDRVSGLETLLGPRYIAVHPSDEPGKRTRRFDGLSESFRGLDEYETTGFAIRLSARSAGSISPGSAVLFRNMPVGVVTGVRLADNAASVEIDAVIEQRYAPLIHTKTRFWDASGVGVDFGLFRGLSIDAGSLDSVLRGAIGFATPKKPGDRVESGAEFDLAPSVNNDWLDWAPEIQLGGR